MEKLVKPTLNIDGDILCYRAASATDGRFYEVTLGNDPHVRFKYKKEADKYIESSPEACKIDLKYEPEPASHAVKVLENSLKSLEKLVSVHVQGIGDRKFYLSRGGSFREKLNPLYKNNREGIRRPEHLNFLKDYLTDTYNAICCEGKYEADDLLAMDQTDNTICCSIDKDMLQFPGHHFNFIKNKYMIVTEEEGNRALYRQLLTGDTADGIPGLRGVGPKTAEKILEGISDPALMYQRCLREYLQRIPLQKGESRTDRAFGIRVLSIIKMNMQMLYLLRFPDDKWTMPVGDMEVIKMFEVGKRVRIIGDSLDDFKFFSIGAEGIIIADHRNGESGWYVHFDKGAYDDSCNGTWYVQPGDMEIIDD